MAEAGGQEFKAILQLYSKVKARKVYLKPYLKKIKIKIKVKKKSGCSFTCIRGAEGAALGGVIPLLRSHPPPPRLWVK